MLNVKDDIQALYSGLPTPTALFSKNKDGVWYLVWQNVAAQTVWGDLDLSEHPQLKLELMDSYSKSGSSCFKYTSINAIDRFSVIATPIHEYVVVK